jgi:hypothetical protein
VFVVVVAVFQMPLGVPSAVRHGSYRQHKPTLTLFEIAMQVFGWFEQFRGTLGRNQESRFRARFTIESVEDSARHNILEVG